MVRTPIDLFVSAPIFDIRNGVPEMAQSLLLRATIPSAYHWRFIRNMRPEVALNYVDVYILMYKVQLNANRPPGITDANIDKAAICLGMSRAVATSYYRIAEGDVMPGERGDVWLEYSPPDVDHPNGRFTTTIHAPQALRTAMTTAVTYSAEDRDAMSVLLRATLGTLPLQGYSLLLTNHHYLSDPATQSFKAFAAVERQFFKDRLLSAWIDTDKELFQDILWHKSCHPVNMTIKYRAATSELVKEQLTVAGAGAASARLPALETEARSGASYLALFDVVKPMFNMYRGGVDTTVLELALETLKRYVPGVENPEPLVPRSELIPASVVNRRTAVAWITQIVKRNAATAAHCFGFYCAMSERTLMANTGGGADTLKSSFALKKLTQTNLPSYTIGYEQFGDYAAARAKARSKGDFVAPIFSVE